MMAGGTLALVVATTIGLADTAVLTVGTLGSRQRGPRVADEPASPGRAPESVRMGVLRVRRHHGGAGLPRDQPGRDR